MKCDHCRNTATENGAICKDCIWYLFLKNRKKPTNLIGKGERELQNEILNCASKYMLKRVRCLEDDIMCVVDHVSISKHALLKRNCYNVTNGIKRLIAQTVSAKCEDLREEFDNVISKCLLVIEEKEKPTLKADVQECASSPLTDNWLQEELTTNSHSHNEENSTTSDTTDKQTAESLPKDVSNCASKKGRKRPNVAVSGTESGRGRSRETFVATYHSELIGDENSIKIRIKKSNLLPTQEKESRKRKSHKQRSDTAYDTRSKRNTMNAVILQNENDAEEPTEQCLEIEGAL